MLGRFPLQSTQNSLLLRSFFQERNPINYNLSNSGLNSDQLLIWYFLEDEEPDLLPDRGRAHFSLCLKIRLNIILNQLV